MCKREKNRFWNNKKKLKKEVQTLINIIKMGTLTLMILLEKKEKNNVEIFGKKVKN